MTSAANDVPDNVRPRVAILSPSLDAVSGVSTHARLLFGSSLAEECRLLHFQVGSEGRSEGLLRRVLRVAASVLQFAVFLVRDRPDIVHLNASLDPKSLWRDAAYLTIAKLFRRRIVFQIHGGAVPDEFFSGHRIRSVAVGRLLKAADAIVLLSETERIAYSRYDSRLRPTVIPNAIDPIGFAATDTSRARRGAPLHLVYLGRLIVSKGILDIVEAVRLMQARGSTVRLTIAGHGRDQKRLLSAIDGLPSRGAVTFRGALFGQEKDQVWQEADIFVFPTYFPEGLPYALLESMAAGAIPVTTPVGAIPEIVQSGVHGVLVAPHDPAGLADVLMQLDADREGMARMSSAARQKILNGYTVSRLVRDFRNLYWHLLSHPTVPSEFRLN